MYVILSASVFFPLLGISGTCIEAIIKGQKDVVLHPITTSLEITHKRLQAIHLKFLQPREAQVATALRMAYFDEKTASNAWETIRNFPVKEYQTEFNVLVAKLDEYKTFWAHLYDWSHLDDEFRGEGKSYLDQIYNRALMIAESVKQRGYPAYGEILTLLELTSLYCNEALFHVSNLSQGLFGYYYLKGYFPGVTERIYPFNWTFAFEVLLPLFNENGAHLGFRTLNDYSASGIGVTEIPTLGAGTNVKVDSTLYNNGSFIFHDLGHAENTFGAMQRFIRNRSYTTKQDTMRDQLDRPNFIFDHTYLDNYLEHLEIRIDRYEKIRNYIDSIPDKRKRILADGVWFVLDHEMNIAYTMLNRQHTDQRTSVSAILKRFTDPADLGQAFKDQAWIQAENIREILTEFEAIVGFELVHRDFINKPAS